MASLAEDASSPPALDDLYNHSGSSEEDGDDGDFQSGTELLTSVSVMKSEARETLLQFIQWQDPAH